MKWLVKMAFFYMLRVLTLLLITVLVSEWRDEIPKRGGDRRSGGNARTRIISGSFLRSKTIMFYLQERQSAVH